MRAIRSRSHYHYVGASAIPWKLPWRLFGRKDEPPLRVLRWRALLAATMGTSAYKPVAPRLEWAMHVARKRMNLDLYPPVSLADFYRRPIDYRNPNATAADRVPLDPPWPGAGDGLALRPWFPVAEPSAMLRDSAWQAVARREPSLLAGGVDTLRALAAEMLSDKRKLPSLRWGVLVWSGLGRERMTSSDRNLFWWAFQVPVFEQFRGFRGELLAEECEARDGWHAREDNCIWEGAALPGPLLVTSLLNLRHPVLRLDCGLTGRISRDPCECGRADMRILDLGALP